MTSNRYFRDATRRDTDESRNTRQIENRNRVDTGSGYNPVSRDRSAQYANDIHNLFSRLSRDKSINKAFDIIQKEKNYLIKHGNIRGKHQESYNILDRLQDAILNENQADIADIAASVRITSRTSSTVRSSLDSIIGNMQQYNNKTQNRDTRRTLRRNNERQDHNGQTSFQRFQDTTKAATQLGDSQHPDYPFKDNPQEPHDLKESNSSYNPESGYTGSSRQTFEHLLQRSLTKLDIKSYNSSDIDRLTQDIYRLYRIGNEHNIYSFAQQAGKDPNNLQALIWSLQQSFNEDSFKDINCPEGIQSITTPGYIHFVNTNPSILSQYESDNNLMRISVNVRPHRFLDATRKAIENIATLDYIYSIKVASNTKLADEYFDNMIITFKKKASGHNSSENLADLTAHVTKIFREDDIRQGHTAFSQPIIPEKPGITYGENFYEQTLPQSWGQYRAGAIAEALLDLKTSSQEITYETLLPKTEEQLTKRGINPQQPHLFLQGWSPNEA